MSWWRSLFTEDVQHLPARELEASCLPKFAALEVVAAGLCCAVGHELAAASCALRANMDHFQTSEFRTARGDLLPVARLPDDVLWGQPRLVRWMVEAVKDCLSKSRSEPMEPVGTPKQGQPDCALIVLAPSPDGYAPEAQSVDAANTRSADVAMQLAKTLGLQFHPASGVLYAGRTGLADALELASTWLAEGQARGQPLRSVLLVAADSLLDVDRIDQLLADQRLLCPGNRDGFIPGEAAAALLLSTAAPVADGTPTGGAGRFNAHQARLCVVGVGEAHEPARWSGGTPNRSIGLTKAVRDACERANGARPQDLRFRLSDQNGESFYAREAATAFARLRAGADARAPFTHLTLADKIGEVGVAGGVAAIAWLSHLWEQQQLLPGACGMADWGMGVVHLSHDDGPRAAVIVEPREPR